MMKPSRKERMRPAELLGFSGLLAAFVGLVVWFTTRDLLLGVIFFGIAFVAILVTVAMLLLAVKPNQPMDGQRTGEPGDGTIPND